MLYMLRLTVCLVMISLAFPGYSRPEGTPPVPEIGKDIPGVDMERLHLDVEKILEEVQKRRASGEGTSVLPTREQKDQGAKEAKKAMESFNSEENQKKLQDEKARVQKKGSPKSNPFVQPHAESNNVAQLQQGLSGSSKETIYIFLSSSVPDEVVHTYLIQAALYGGGRIIPVYHGLTNGLIDKKAADRYFGHIMQENLDCVNVQGQSCLRMKVKIKVGSALFKQYGITRVPAVVYTNGEDSWTLGGDSAIDYILERINSEAHSPFLEELIKRLRGIHLERRDQDRSAGKH
jgi:conjugal transfer pilus assembly protein TrbC